MKSFPIKRRRNKIRLFAFILLIAVWSGAANVIAEDPGSKELTMKIRITAGDKVLTATMYDNATSRDFMELLPLTLTLKDYAGTEKVSDLPKKLSIKGAPAGTDARAGDITLYSPWGNLAIFYRGFGYAGGLVTMGRIDSGLEQLPDVNGDVLFERWD